MTMYIPGNQLHGVLENYPFIDIYHLVMTNIAVERSTIFKNDKPSISIRAMA